MAGTAYPLPERSDEEVRDAIFIVKSKNQTGSGFLTLDRQHILTARHVVEGIQPEREKVAVQNTRTKEPHSCVVQRLWDDWDVALLRLVKSIEDRAILPFNLSQQKPVAGNDFSTYGFPDDFVDYYSGWFYGKIGNEEEDRKYTITFNITFGPAYYGGTLGGLSGGPIFDMSNRSPVIGIICNHGPVNYQIGKMVPIVGIYQDLVHEITADENYLELVRGYVQKADDSVYDACNLFDEKKTSVPEQFKKALLFLETAQEQLLQLFKLLEEPSFIDQADSIDRSSIIHQINIVNTKINNHLVPSLRQNRVGRFSSVIHAMKEFNKLIPPSTNPK